MVCCNGLDLDRVSDASLPLVIGLRQGATAIILAHLVQTLHSLYYGYMSKHSMTPQKRQVWWWSQGSNKITYRPEELKAEKKHHYLYVHTWKPTENWQACMYRTARHTTCTCTIIQTNRRHCICHLGYNWSFFCFGLNLWTSEHSHSGT